MEKSKNTLSKKHLSFFYNKKNLHTWFLFGLIILICVYFDFYFQNNKLLIPFLTATLLSTITTFIAIPILKKVKIKQFIREEGPRNHFTKEGTPTMGGVFFIPIGIIISNILYFNQYNYKIILTLSFLIIFFMFIGLIDDYLSLRKKFNTGLTSNQKLILQFLISLIFITICASNDYISNTIQVNNNMIYIGKFIYPLAIFVLLAESNSTNLTDGLDGLLSGCSALIFTGLAITILLENTNNDLTLAPLCIAMAGACTGFLFFNKYPAKLFMGDSGSLAIGASLGGIALLTNNLWSLLIMGGILAAESISVIIQVIIFKISKRLNGKGYKVFLMTPIHHHFELKGNKEIEIVCCFWFITLILIIINLVFFTQP